MFFLPDLEGYFVNTDKSFPNFFLYFSNSNILIMNKKWTLNGLFLAILPLLFVTEFSWSQCGNSGTSLWSENFDDTAGINYTGSDPGIGFTNSGGTDWFDVSAPGGGYSYTTNFFRIRDTNGDYSSSVQSFTSPVINISGESNLEFSGLFAGTPTSGEFDINDFIDIEYQLDGSGTWVNAWHADGFTSTSNGMRGECYVGLDWTAQCVSFDVPTGTSVQFRFTFHSDGSAARIGLDDFSLVAKCGIVELGAANTECDARTNGATGDTYTVTIPYFGSDASAGVTANYTGGGTVSFTPSAADGNLVISGIPENENWSVTVTGGDGTCNLSANGNAPLCDAAPVTPALPATYISITACLTEATDIAQDVAADGAAVGAVPYGSWAAAVARCSTEMADNGVLYDIVFDPGNYERTTWNNLGATIDPILNGLRVFGQGAVLDNQNTNTETFAQVQADNVSFYDITLKNYASTIGGAAEIYDVQNILWSNCVFDACDGNSNAGDGFEIGNNRLGTSRNTSVKFYNCTFQNHLVDGLTSSAMTIETNQDPAGGPYFVDVDFVDCRWICNVRNAMGGALSIGQATTGPTSTDPGPTVRMVGGFFEGNRGDSGSADGGAIDAQDNTLLTIDGTNFMCNIAEVGTGTSGGGAIRIQSGSDVYISNSNFSSNKATNISGALIGNGGAILISGTDSYLQTTNCTFVDNETGAGGAIYVGNLTPVVLSSTIFDSNHAVGNGGAVGVEAGDGTSRNQMIFRMEACRVTNNTIAGSGNNRGGLFVDFAETSTGASGINSGAEDYIEIYSTTICGNTDGGGTASDYEIRHENASTDFQCSSTYLEGSTVIGSGSAVNDYTEDYSTGGCPIVGAETPLACAGCLPVPASDRGCFTIEGIVFLDNYGDGTIGNNDGSSFGSLDGTSGGADAVLGDIPVKLYSCGLDGICGSIDDKLIESTVTLAADGSYIFENLAADDYYVVFSNTDGTDTYTFTTDNNAGTVATSSIDSDAADDATTNAMTLGATGMIRLSDSNPIESDVNAGLYLPVTVSGIVQNDTDGNGVGDAPYPNGDAIIVVTMAGPDGDCSTTGDNPAVSVTAAAGTGAYSIEVPPGIICETNILVPPGGDPANPSSGNTLQASLTTILGQDMVPPGGTTGTAGLFPSNSSSVNNNFALPVELKFFTVKNVDCEAILKWVTASEVNADFFAVERSLDGRVFEEIGKVFATGNSASEQNYSFTDLTPMTGTSIYRLRMVDKDGRFEYSRTIAFVSCGKSGLSVFPVPARDQVTLTGMGDNASGVILVFNIDGKLVEQQSLDSVSDEFILDISSYSSGIYWIKFESAVGISSTKFIVE